MRKKSVFILLIFSMLLPSYSWPMSNQESQEEIQCSSDDDCKKNECCASSTVFLYPFPTSVIWKCVPLGKEGDWCNTLKNNYCPCKSGFHCRSKSDWFFGTGNCERKK
ncbi:uncharacterized protein LOC111630178 [Centruroides sculpturatus]|uniref:uncharacterized protein LOC111630178 n=1 Tax=Centruroides sculpturatus TaxID=218467 RepID=UPI000C6ED9A8|nr:uncharacterized protein LOC111630178 [Centruroides sculpturatus]